MKLMKQPWVFAGVMLGAILGAQAESIVVVDEIRYPTSYKEQSVDHSIDARYRAPIPDRFEPRNVGTSLGLKSVAATPPKVVVKDRPPMVTVIFPDGTEVNFWDRAISMVRGVPYRGIGFVNGMYCARNMNTGEVVYFRQPTRPE